MPVLWPATSRHIYSNTSRMLIYAYQPKIGLRRNTRRAYKGGLTSREFHPWNSYQIVYHYFKFFNF